MSEKRTFIKSAAILSVSGIIVKLLGAALRIPLSNKIGAGMAYYNVAYTIYAIFLVLATAGIPVAISRLVSERLSMGNGRGAHKVFTTALKLMLTIGLASFAICYFGAGAISEAIKIPDAEISLKAIAPALCLVPMLSAFRGYFQGQQNMTPTAISEIGEQVVRVIVGLGLGFYLFSRGLDVAAAGATFGAGAGALVGILIIMVIYIADSRRREVRLLRASGQEESQWSILKKIAWIAIPIIIGAEIMPIMSTIDTSIIVARLQATGWTADEALDLYSQYGAYCDTLISLPQTFTQAIAVSLVPSIAAFFWQNKIEKVNANIKISMRLTMIMACPCAVGLFVLARPILAMLYTDQLESAIAAVPTLRVMTIGVILLAISQTTTGALQSIDRQMNPVKNLAIGACAKIVITYVLVGVAPINVKGAAIGTNAAYLIALLLNMRSVKKCTGVKFDILLTYVKPMAASLIMGICVYSSYVLLLGYTRGYIATIVSIFVGIAVYAVTIIRMGAISVEELKLVPCGEIMIKLFRL